MSHRPFAEQKSYDFDRDVWVSGVFPRALTYREHPAPLDPPNPPLWTAGRQVRATFDPKGIALVCVAMFAVATVPWTGVWPAIFILSLLGVAFFVFHDGGPDSAEKSDLRLLEDPRDPEVCLVQVVIASREGATRRDRGVVWFSEGRLLFSGQRTSFAVGGEDVLPLSAWPPVPDHGPEAFPENTLPLRENGRCLVFTSLRHPHDWERQRALFFSRLRDFRTRPPLSRGPRQAPPFRIQESSDAVSLGLSA